LALAPTLLGPVPAYAEASNRYRLGAGDRLRVTVFGEDKLSGEFAVAGGGAMSFPLLGDIPVGGMTLVEFTQMLTKRLATGYLRDPRVTAEIINMRPVYILGEVMRPGEHAFVDGMSVYAAVAKAGGFTYRANQKIVFIRRENETVERRIPLTSATQVAPGDTIRIAQRFF
jgi:protein involved in polysaccharide export with SLBB domain